jgi:hypothetical protein
VAHDAFANAPTSIFQDRTSSAQSELAAAGIEPAYADIKPFTVLLSKL